MQCVEVARTPKSSGDKGKGKGKEKEKAKPSELSGYEYHEASVHDLALRADILRGYERFKVFFICLAWQILRLLS